MPTGSFKPRGALFALRSKLYEKPVREVVAASTGNHGAALALPVWTQVMNKAAQHYPAEPLQPTMPIQHAMVCSISNHLATTGCMAAGTAYDIDLPADKVPTAACEVHGGRQWPFAQQFQDVPQKAFSFPGRLFKSFRRLFGGR